MKRIICLVLILWSVSRAFGDNFWSALTNNDFPAIQAYIDKQGFDVSHQPVMGFYFANYKSFDKNLMTYLLAKGADINKEYKGSSPLVYLLSRDNGELEWCMELLLTNGVEIDPTALKKAYTACSIDVVKLLLSQKIALTETDVRDLMKSAYKKNNLALGGMLIDMSSHQTILDEAFLWAIQDGRLAWVQLLYSKGANIEQEVPITIPQTGSKKTLGVVALARNFGHEDIAQFLVEIGAEIDEVQAMAILNKAYKNDDLDAAENILNRKSLASLKSRLLLSAVKDRNIKWVTSLIFKGADVNALINGEYSMLFYGIKSADPDLLAVLKSFGARLHEGEAGSLIEAVYDQNDLKLLEILLNMGMTVEDMNHILIRSVKENRKDWMVALIAKGADIHSTDKEGVTIFIHALNAGSFDIVKELLQRDEMHEPSFEIFKEQYPKYELLWAAIINDAKWIKKYARNKKLAELKGPHNMSAMELYLAIYGGTVLHWYALADDSRSLKKVLPQMRDKIYEVDNKGRKAVDLADNDSIQAMIQEFMY